MKTTANSVIYFAILVLFVAVASAEQPTEAPAGYDDQTIDTSFVSADLHNTDKGLFEEKKDISPNGLGPLYNAQSCRECHQNPTTGAVSQITEL